MPAPIVVVGSLNMDLVVRCRAIPRPGQTVAGGDLTETPGGKGANQAVAAARLADGRQPVRMVGRVGDDPLGTRLRDELNRHRVDTNDVRRSPGPSGTAIILVDDVHGENAIVVSPGANGRMMPADVPDLSTAAVVLVQLEIPLPTVMAVAAPLLILDPAPVPPDGLADELLRRIDILTPNQTEAEALTGVPVRTTDDAARAAAVLIGRGVRRVVTKLGAAGCCVSERTADGNVATTPVPGFAVDVVDTTAAGDTFNGALAVALAEGVAMVDAAKFANVAGALACTKPGAQAAVPTRAEVEQLFRHPSCRR